MIILIENIIEKLNNLFPEKRRIKNGSYRNEIELDFKNKNPKIAGTLLLIYPKNDSFLCLIQRNKYKGLIAIKYLFQEVKMKLVNL